MGCKRGGEKGTGGESVDSILPNKRGERRGQRRACTDLPKQAHCTSEKRDSNEGWVRIKGNPFRERYRGEED